MSVGWRQPLIAIYLQARTICDDLYLILNGQITVRNIKLRDDVLTGLRLTALFLHSHCLCQSQCAGVQKATHP